MPTDQSLVHAVPVEFEEDYVAFITLGHNCRCLDEEEERIIAKKANELRPETYWSLSKIHPTTFLTAHRTG